MCIRVCVCTNCSPFCLCDQLIFSQLDPLESKEQRAQSVWMADNMLIEEKRHTVMKSEVEVHILFKGRKLQ